MIRLALAQQGLKRRGLVRPLNLGMVGWTALADTYTIIEEQQELLDAITERRNRCRIVNDLLRIFYRDATTGWGGGYVKLDTEIEKHNFNVEQECRLIIPTCDRALGLLENVLKI